MARKRNYRAEYRKRISRAKARGLSRAVGRGHAPEGVLGIKAAEFLSLRPGAVVRVKAGKSVKSIVAADAKRVFKGRKPKRGRYNPKTGKVVSRRKGESSLDYYERTEGWEGESPDEYQLRLEGIMRKRGAFAWEDEKRFLGQMKALRVSEREAYTHWFSP